MKGHGTNISLNRNRELYEEFLCGACSMEFLAEPIGLIICEASSILERVDGELKNASVA
jgi:hypothetical protein